MFVPSVQWLQSSLQQEAIGLARNPARMELRLVGNSRFVAVIVRDRSPASAAAAANAYAAKAVNLLQARYSASPDSGPSRVVDLADPGDAEPLEKARSWRVLVSLGILIFSGAYGALSLFARPRPKMA